MSPGDRVSTPTGPARIERQDHEYPDFWWVLTDKGALGLCLTRELRKIEEP